MNHSVRLGAGAVTISITLVLLEDAPVSPRPEDPANSREEIPEPAPHPAVVTGNLINHGVSCHEGFANPGTYEESTQDQKDRAEAQRALALHLRQVLNKAEKRPEKTSTQDLLSATREQERTRFRKLSKRQDGRPIFAR